MDTVINTVPGNTASTEKTVSELILQDNMYRSSIGHSRYALTVSEFCHDYGWSIRKMNKWLGEHGFQYKVARQRCWIPNQSLEDSGYVVMKSGEHYLGSGFVDLYCKNYWTPSGRLLIHDKLKEEDILPLVEYETAACKARKEANTLCVSML